MSAHSEHQGSVHSSPLLLAPNIFIAKEIETVLFFVASSSTLRHAHSTFMPNSCKETRLFIQRIVGIYYR